MLVVTDEKSSQPAPVETTKVEEIEVPELVEAFQRSTLKEFGGGYLVDTSEAIAELVDSLVDLQTSSPSLYIDIEGVKLCRYGLVSIV
jgi:hypothetical protein